MKTLIVGTGAQGSVIAIELAENPEVDEIKCVFNLLKVRD
jgi:ketopantoate reductase